MVEFGRLVHFTTPPARLATDRRVPGTPYVIPGCGPIEANEHVPNTRRSRTGCFPQPPGCGPIEAYASGSSKDLWRRYPLPRVSRVSRIFRGFIAIYCRLSALAEIYTLMSGVT